MKTITLTEEQARVVMRCLDIAVRAGGLENAVTALPIAQTIEAQLSTPESSEVLVPENE